MTDIHSHILPNMDDGSDSPEMSCEMLRTSREMGVDAIIMTPHFYPDREPPESFVQRRKESAKALLSAVNKSGNDEYPRIYLGAEVAFYEGMSRSREIRNLCVVGTDKILIEMPFAKWTDRTVDELIEIKNSGGVQVILAHIDRYLKFADKSMLKELYFNGIMFQANAEALTAFSTKRKILPMIDGESVKFIGSDCHNMGRRPPNFADALTVIREKLDDQALKMLEYYSKWIINDAAPLDEAVKAF